MEHIVIFDYDDTLVQSSAALYGADSKTAVSLGLRAPSKEAYFAVWGKPHEEMIQLLYPGIDVAVYLQKYRALYEPAMLKLFPDAQATIRALVEQKFRLAVLSSKQKSFLVEHLRQAGIAACFEYVHAAESSSFKKPDPHVFDDVIRHFGIATSQMTYVGDSVQDFVAASRAGLNFIAVTTGISTADDFRKMGCMTIVESLSQLKTLFA